MPKADYPPGQTLGQPRKKNRWVERDCGYETPCWVWRLYRNTRGYGVEWDGERIRLAHCITYERERGPVPDGLELDHLCRNPACINPAHLEPVTHLENVQRGDKAKTHCIRGHAFDAENTYVMSPTASHSEGMRVCRTCRLMRQRRWKARQKGRT